MPKYTINGVSYTSASPLSDADLEELSGSAPVQGYGSPPTATEQMFGMGSPIARTVKGAVGNPLMALNQVGGEAIGGLGDIVQQTNQATGLNSDWLNSLATGAQGIRTGANQAANQYEAQTQAARAKMGSTGFDPLELTGAVISPLNKILPGRGVAAATANAMLNPVTGENLDSWDIAKGKMEQAGIGAILGKTAEEVLPALKAGARQLLESGVALEPGQAFKGAAGALMSSTEGFRDTIYKLIGKDIHPDKLNKAFTYATVNEALAPIKQFVSKTNEDGFAMVDQGIKAARKSYDTAFSKVGTVTADDGLFSAVTDIRNKAQDLLDPKEFAKFNKEIERNFVNKFEKTTSVPSSATGTVPAIPEEVFATNGQKLHDIKRWLQARLSNLGQATEELPKDRESLFKELYTNFQDYTHRVDPTGLIKATDTAYANMMRVAAASKSASTRSGNFSPDQLMNAATSQSSTFVGGSGKAPMQQFAKEAKNVMGNEKANTITFSDLKNAGVASGLGYTGLLNLPVIAGATAAGTTADLLGKLALKNPAAYEKLRESVLKQQGLLGRAAGNVYSQPQ